MPVEDQVGVVVMVGGGRTETAVEQTLRRARQAAARDLIEQSLDIPRARPIVVLSDDAGWLESLESYPVQTELNVSGQPFHFGKALAELIARHDLQRCFYAGGGSAPLLSTAQLEQVLGAVLSQEPLMVTNNLYSADWAAFSPAGALIPLVPWLERDNALSWVWQERGRAPVRALERTPATQMDIDTPFDLLALARSQRTHAHLAAFLAELDWPSQHLDAAIAVLRRDGSQVIIAGRVSSWAWNLLERHTRAWVRVFAEERGMRASGRQARGEVRSLLNAYLDLVGVDRFFERLAEMADAVLLDSRVILASRGLWPSDADRFHADLLMDDRVSEPFLRALTAAARQAPVPVVVGGHSLVAGGLGVVLEGAGLMDNA
jgi:hypothetical protein